ncbi:Resistance to phytophthora 1 isoform 2 [Hibiscus syriacus]|uniref:Resistance to phytophthora 1 isoform 2 n=1 Tax=Hibiscus syriacus TaxID=106335 RepID=A0A6A2XWF4_HIBSY|nr:protein RESISTANCE TO PHYTOPHTHORA 1, chloroplastic-like [Hibiscus syriacus]KAE8660637.1 Resistance to phytophthora 1 isoform 2 [Hibiscus syriacus]
MYSLMSTTPLCNYGVSNFPLPTSSHLKYIKNNNPKFLSFRKALQIHANATNEVDAQTGTVEDLKKVVQKTAATFAPRASTATKNPAVPGTALYTVFEVQGYVSLLLGGALSFNLIFPSNEPDIWRLMGMWSIWMFTIPSLRARDCSKNEKEALNYLFLIIPLINVIIPFFWKSFAVVWSADTVAFFAMYAWKLGWLHKTE